jgi:hypothetical protein
VLRLVLVTISSFPLTASPNERVVTEFEDWAHVLEIDQRVTAEITKFSHQDDSLDEHYAANLGANVHRLIVREASYRIGQLIAGNQEPFIRVNDLEPGFADPRQQEPAHRAARHFEKSFIHTEVVAIFKVTGMPPQDALREYTNPDFRKKVSSQLKEIGVDGGLHQFHPNDRPWTNKQTYWADQYRQLPVKGD